MEDVERDIVSGHVPDFYYSDFLKDERRPINKVAQGRTRLVSGSPIVLSLLTRRYFSGFAGWVMANHVSNGSAVGINVYSSHWDILARKICSMGDNVLCGDFSNFDGSLRPEYLEFIGKRIDLWYGDGNTRIREVIWENVWRSKHVNGKLMYQWRQGLPSGHPLTSIINSIYNLSSIYFMYCDIVGLDILRWPLEEHLTCVVYGDDNIISLSNEVIAKFDVPLIVEAFGKIGLTYTPPTKDTGELRFGPISSATFLKRGFRYDETYLRFMAPLDLEVILETPMWTKRGALKMEIVISNVEDSLHELSLHSRHIFGTYAPQLISASVEHLDYHPLVTDYDNLRQRTLARVERW